MVRSLRLLICFLKGTRSGGLVSSSVGFVLMPSFKSSKRFVCSLLNPEGSLSQRGCLPKWPFFSLKPQQRMWVSSAPCSGAKCACAGTPHSSPKDCLPSLPIRSLSWQHMTLLSNNVRRMRYQNGISLWGLAPYMESKTGPCQSESLFIWLADCALSKQRLCKLTVDESPRLLRHTLQQHKA